MKATFNITKANRKRLRFIGDNLYENWKVKVNTPFQIERIMNEAIKMLYNDMLDKVNQGNEHDNIPLINRIED